MIKSKHVANNTLAIDEIMGKIKVRAMAENILIRPAVQGLVYSVLKEMVEKGNFFGGWVVIGDEEIDGATVYTWAPLGQVDQSLHPIDTFTVARG